MRKVLLLAAIGICLAVRCSSHNNVAGTSVETDTGTSCKVLGLMEYANGTPVVGAAVRLIDSAAVQVMMVGSAKTRALAKANALIRSGLTTTDPTGFFQFDSVDTSKYYVLVNDHDLLGGKFMAVVDTGDTVIRVNGILQRMGTVQGSIDTSLLNKNGWTFVYVPEVNEKVLVGTDGTFILGVLPPGTYTIKLVYGNTVQASPLDSVTVPVKSDSTTTLQNIGTGYGAVTITVTVEEPN
jgi:hypothetical protein